MLCTLQSVIVNGQRWSVIYWPILTMHSLCSSTTVGLSLLVSAVVLLSVHYVAVPYSQQFNYFALDAHTVLYCNFDSLVYTL